MNKYEFNKKLESIGINKYIFQQYLIELLNFKNYCKNNNIPYIINFHKRNHLYNNSIITNLVIDRDIKITNILIKNNKNNYYIASIENNDYNPTIALCIKICKALNKTLDELFWEAKNEWWKSHKRKWKN